MNVNTLLVEDDPVMAVTLGRMLAEWGHEVTTAADGEEAVGHVHGEPFDLVISDIQLPRLNGDEVMLKAHKVVPDLPFILITGHGTVKEAVKATQNGAFQYLLKPIDPEELKVIVERALESTRLRRENRLLRSEMAGLGPQGERFIGRSPGMMEVHELIARVAGTGSTVLITGETGTGKEVVAQTIHYRSPRADGPMVAFNCAAFNENLMESELFGHEKGAFTGAAATRRGRFEDADGGTIFLDEIGETSKEFQARLLRVLQEQEIERVGSSKKIKVDVRVLASTNRDLPKDVRDGAFREDLYYRLRVVPIHLPPLRERKEDIPLLARHFIERFREAYGSSVRDISDAGMRHLEEQPWYGNVRELKHTIERAVVLGAGDLIEPADLALPKGPASGEADTPESDGLQEAMDQAARQHVLRILDRTNWHKQEAARRLGVDRATLYRMVKKYSLER